jgi:hypothetical protein
VAAFCKEKKKYSQDSQEDEKDKSGEFCEKNWFNSS